MSKVDPHSLHVWFFIQSQKKANLKLTYDSTDEENFGFASPEEMRGLENETLSAAYCTV